MNPTAVHALEAVAAGEDVPADELRLATAVMLEAWSTLHDGVIKALKEAPYDRWALSRRAAYEYEARGLADDPLGLYAAAPGMLPDLLARWAATSPAVCFGPTPVAPSEI